MEVEEEEEPIVHALKPSSAHQQSTTTTNNTSSAAADAMVARYQEKARRMEAERDAVQAELDEMRELRYTQAEKQFADLKRISEQRYKGQSPSSRLLALCCVG